MRKLDFIVKAFSYEDDAPHYITKYNNIFHSNGTFETACHFNTEEEAEKAINKIKEDTFPSYGFKDWYIIQTETVINVHRFVKHIAFENF